MPAGFPPGALCRLQAFGFQLELHAGFPESLACQLQTLGHLKPYNHMSQFLVIPHTYMSICIFCFSGEP